MKLLSSPWRLVAPWNRAWKPQLFTLDSSECFGTEFALEGAFGLPEGVLAEVQDDQTSALLQHMNHQGLPRKS